MKPLFRWSIRGWLVAAVVIASVVAGFLVVSLTPAVKAAPEEQAPLECLSCHTRVLKGHDKLGEGSKACWICHDSTKIGILRLLNGTQLPLSGSPQVCGQCHTQRYQAWQEGTHGILSGKAELDFLGGRKLQCVTCHNPHQPEIDLTKLVIPSSPTFGSGASLECLSCHARVLQGHDKLGEGSEACRVCHSSTQMGVLHLAGGETLLPMSDSPKLCAQCHQARYESWVAGTHGMPAWKEGIVEIHGVSQVGCISCHDPHQPQVAFSGITRPHPLAQPPPEPPSSVLLALFATALLLIIAVGVVLVRKGE